MLGSLVTPLTHARALCSPLIAACVMYVCCAHARDPCIDAVVTEAGIAGDKVVIFMPWTEIHSSYLVDLSIFAQTEPRKPLRLTP